MSMVLVLLLVAVFRRIPVPVPMPMPMPIPVHLQTHKRVPRNGENTITLSITIDTNIKPRKRVLARGVLFL